MARNSKISKALLIAIVIIVALVLIAAVIIYAVKPELYHKYLGFGEHTWSEWETSKEPSCTKDGEKKKHCLVCGDEDISAIPSTGHSWTEWETTAEADCGNDGLKQRHCNSCDEKESETIPKTGEHSWSEWSTVKQNDCGNDGLKKRVCATCEEEESETVPKTGLHNFVDGVCDVCGTLESSSGTAEEVEKSELSIHFLELGNKYTGDCTLIKYGNTEVLIDAGSRRNSAITIKNYVDKYCTDGALEYVIATHAHQDHIAGFVGSNSGNTKTGILYQYKIGTLIQFAGTNATTEIYSDYCAAVEYAKGQGATVYTAKQCWYETDGAKKKYYLDEAQTVSMNILYHKFYEESTSDENDYSVCMLLTQIAGDNTYNYLFTGDLEADGEASLVESNALPEVELFKGGHHGSYTASTDKLLSVIKPKNVAVCCCCGTTEYTSNSDNTFPAQAFIDRVSKYTENIYCTTLMIDYKAGEYTSMNGNIVFYTKNGILKLYCSNNDIILKDTDWFKQNRKWNN